MDVEIRRPALRDTEELNEFFRIVISDTFAKEGIAEKVDDLAEEVETKKNYLKADFESCGERRYFLIAQAGGKMIGSIEFGAASSLIVKCTNGAYSGLVQVGTVFVHPDYQRKGVGSFLLKKIGQVLKGQGIEEFCLDSGYKTAQTIWEKKFGEPAYVLEDYWDEGYAHMIWKNNVRELL
ncbi:N-acetyltransferase [Neobacillus notoginsengisoli]|uniref:N-acetyltransferase n=1 Tax=Neobacillus notoginsengisoli TaxID=1578198 RepID=A0A417YZM8_9BACI|nr:GNAT family N-acetyltransferase [Neobacillus notoginsengisoli]RHW43246.1 N-acetyltransferase [Neobacillus notoginsengisoli]